MSLLDSGAYRILESLIHTFSIPDVSNRPTAFRFNENIYPFVNVWTFIPVSSVMRFNIILTKIKS